MTAYNVHLKLSPRDREIGKPAQTIITNDFNFVVGVGDVVVPNDTITFHPATAVPNYSGSYQYDVIGIETAYWNTPSSSFTVSGSPVTITAKNVQATDTWTLDPREGGFTSRSETVVIRTPDYTPDTPTFNNVTGANPSDIAESNSVKITGIDNGCPVTISGNNCWIERGYASDRTDKLKSTTISNNGYVKFVCQTPSTFGTTVSFTVTIGTWSATWSVTTREIGDDISYIPVPYSGTTIKLSDVIATFQNPTQTTVRNLGAYLRAPAGNLVPDISVNANVPTSLPIRLSNFIGARNALYWVKKPQNRNYSYNTVANGTTTIETGWGIGGADYLQEWSLGFGSYLDEYAEIRYEYSTSAGVTVEVDGGNPSAWSKRNRWIRLSATGVSGREDTFTATVTIYVRHPVDTSVVLSTSMTATWFFWGV